MLVILPPPPPHRVLNSTEGIMVSPPIHQMCWKRPKYWTLPIALDTRHKEWLYRKKSSALSLWKEWWDHIGPYRYQLIPSAKASQAAASTFLHLTNLYVYGSISLGDRTLQNLGIFPNWTTNISKSSITKFNTHILPVSVIRRILSWLNAQHWQPCRELKELFDDTMDHIPERRSAFLHMKR